MKTTKTEAADNQIDAGAGIGKADPIPKVGAPKPPKDYVPTKGPARARIQPLPDVIKVAAAAGKEIASSTKYTADFAASAPDAETLAANLAFAAQWSAQLELAEIWCNYTREQTRLAWLQANPQLDDFAPTFAYARDHDDTVGTRYASTAKLFDARSQPAVKGAAVRASKKAANKAASRKSAKASAEAPSTQDAAAAPAAAKPTASTGSATTS